LFHALLIDNIDGSNTSSLWQLTMELRHLRYFLALAEKLHFLRAANTLHVSQSTLSHQIKQLEDELGKRLFLRQKRKVSLTDAGRSFLSHATGVLAGVDQALLSVKQTGPAIRSVVRVVATPTISVSLLPDCIAKFHTSFPGSRIVIEEVTDTAEIRRLLLDEGTDIGIAYPPFDTTELWFEALYDEDMLLVVPANHALARKRKIRLVDLHGQRMALTHSTVHRQMLDGYLRSVGAEPEVIVELTGGISTLMHLISSLNVAAIVPQYAASTDRNFKILPIERPLPVRTPSVYVKRSRQLSAAARGLLSIIRQVASERASDKATRR